MFRRLRRALITLLEEDKSLNSALEKGSIGVPIGHYVGPSSDFDSSSANFKIVKAKGGYVINVSRYDVVADRNHNSVYVITDECDLGAEISRILTMESLYLS